jgi:pyruvate dehydrogenase E2 component (dihydrolipoamide acetyltransferase)
MMKVTLSCDHRVIDGAMGAKFVNAIKAKLEDRELWNSMV